MLCGLAEERNALYGTGPGTDDRHPLVCEAIEVTVWPSARVFVVPAARVEGMTREVAEAGDAGEFRAVQRTVGHGHEPGPERISPIGVHDPA